MRYRYIGSAVIVSFLSGCSLTPKQLQALDGAVCNKATAAGMTFTTSAVGGASKSVGIHINGGDCSIQTAGK